MFGLIYITTLMSDHPNVWTDGSLALDRITGVSSSGAGFLLAILRSTGVDFGGVMLIEFALRVRWILAEVSALFLGLSSLFRELRCGVLCWVLQSSGAVHLGVDNLGVVRHVGRLLDGHCGSAPFELVNDGDLLLLIERM